MSDGALKIFLSTKKKLEMLQKSSFKRKNHRNEKCEAL